MRDAQVINYLLRSTWAIHEPVLRQLHGVVMAHARGDRLSAVQIAQITNARDERVGALQSTHALEVQAEGSDIGYSIHEGVAVVPVRGVLARRADQVNGVSQAQGTSCEALRAMVLDAADKPQVGAILLAIDSPGGAVEGCKAAADLIFDVSREKHVVAQVDECACSAAYWLASQANEIVIPPTGLAGSVGVFGVVSDTSRLFEEEFKTTVHLIRSGRHKGIGTPGVPIEDDNLEALQSEVDTSHAVFVADIARGLEVPEERVEEIADGRTFVGANAVREGLADRLGSFDETLSALIDTHGTPIAAAV